MVLLAILGVACAVAIGAGAVSHARAARRAREEAMHQALAFYAHAQTWTRVHHEGRRWVKSEATTDRGARARRALGWKETP